MKRAAVRVVCCLILIGVVAEGATGANPSKDAGKRNAATSGSAVDVSYLANGGRRPCGPLTDDGEGDCANFMLSRGRLDFSIRTLAGELPFARCLYNYDLQVDGSGRTRMSGIISAGENPCNDVRPCKNATRPGWAPWEGRIVREPDGGLLHRVDACIDTCLGQFKGQLVMRLDKRGRAWRASVRRDFVGTSGFVLEGGEWDWRIPGLELR